MAEEKVAIQRLVRNAKGMMDVTYVDAKTGQPVTNLAGYRIARQDPDTHLKQIYSGDFSGGLGSTTDTTSPPSQDGSIAKKTLEDLMQRNGPGEEGREVADRTPTNNFGYIDKPAALGLLSAVPGIPGMAGKAVNGMINANNLAAVNAARSFLGLPEVTGLDAVKGIAMDNKGFVADVVIGEETYAVGLEASTPSGRTTLTPNEARSRAAAIGKGKIGITEATPEQSKEAEAKHAEAFGKESQGILGGLLGTAKSVMDAITGGSPMKGIKSPVPASPLSKAPTSTSPTGIATPETAAKVDVTPGVGLANLAGAAGKVGYNMGPGRPNAPSESIQSLGLQAVQSALGPGYGISITSGQENAGKDYSGAGRHPTGLAMDFQVVDPQGNIVTNLRALEEVAKSLANLGVTGIGVGKGYMGGTAIHADIAKPGQPAAWGKAGKGKNMSPGLESALESTMGIVGGLTPLPTPPTPTTNPAKGTAVDPLSYGPEQGTSSLALDAITGFLSEAFGVGSAQAQEVSEQGAARADITDPVSREAPSDADISRMAQAIAGELGPSTIAGIRSGNPEAMAEAAREIAAITGVMANRMAATGHSKGGSLDNVLDPGQFNSLMSGNLGTTNENYGLVGDFIENAIRGFYSGTNPSPVPQASHYYNPSLVSPGWANSTRSGMTDVGEHSFGDVVVPGTQRSEFQQGLPSTPSVGLSKPEPGGLAGAISREAVAAPSVSGSQGIGGAGAGRGTSPGGPGLGSGGFGESSKGGKAGGGIADIGSVGSFGITGQTADRSGYGTASPGTGAFGSAPGAGYGSQQGAGLGGGIGGNVTGSMSSKEAMSAAEGSFGGFSAGSLSGSASGLGTGFGAIGASPTPGFGGPAAAQGKGTISVESLSTGETSKGGVNQGVGKQNTPGPMGPEIDQAPTKGVPVSFETTTTHSYSAGYGMGGLGGFGGSSGSSSSSSSSAGKGPAGGAHSDNPGMSGYGASGDSGGGGGAKVLCTYFYDIRWLPKEIYEGDLFYADLFVSNEMSKGYRKWAEPLADWLRKKDRPIIKRILFPFVKAWAEEMSYRVGLRKTPNKLGQIMCLIGEPICTKIGKATR